MRAALLIARKDLRQRVRDRSFFIWGVVAPFGLAAIFSFVFNPVTNATFHADYVLVDQDRGAIATAFRGQLAAMEGQGIVTVREAASVEEARAQVEAGSDEFSGGDGPTADAAFVLPAGLSDAAMAGQGGSITVIGPEGSSLGSQVAVSLADGFSARLKSVDTAVRTAIGAGASPAEVQALAQRAAQVPDPISLQDITASTRQLDGTTQMTAGMAIFFAFFTVQFGVSGLLEERRLGTMGRLLAAPVSRGSIIAGKALATFGLGVLSLAILVVASTFLLGADWGNPVGVAALIVAAVVAAMGVLGIVAAVAKTQEQAGNFASVVSMVLGIFGGVFFSVAQVGGIVATLSLFTPHAWFMRGLGDLAGGDVSAIVPSVVALLGFGLVTGSASYYFLRRSLLR